MKLPSKRTVMGVGGALALTATTIFSSGCGSRIRFMGMERDPLTGDWNTVPAEVFEAERAQYETFASSRLDYNR